MENTNEPRDEAAEKELAGVPEELLDNDEDASGEDAAAQKIAQLESSSLDEDEQLELLKQLFDSAKTTHKLDR